MDTVVKNDVLTDEMLQGFANRVALYDRENRFFQEDFDVLREAGYLTLNVPKELGGQGHTLAAASSSEKNSAVKAGGNLAGAKEIGRLLAERAKEKGINKVVFDRGGYLYHGRVKALADAAREAGLEF